MEFLLKDLIAAPLTAQVGKIWGFPKVRAIYLCWGSTLGSPHFPTM